MQTLVKVASIQRSFSSPALMPLRYSERWKQGWRCVMDPTAVPSSKVYIRLAVLACATLYIHSHRSLCTEYYAVQALHPEYLICIGLYLLSWRSLAL